MLKIFKSWILFAFIIVGFCGLVDVAVQQNLRQSANDPQIQIAEDAAVALASGTPVQIPSNTVDIAKSLAPYIVIYDNSGKPVSGNGRLNGSLPSLPSGVFDSTRATGEDRLTWQPEPSVRSAVVVVHVQSSSTEAFVMAGRSLREVEFREDQLSFEVGTSVFFLLLGTFLIKLVLSSWEI